MTNSTQKSDTLIRVAALACFATAAFFGLRSLQPETTSVLPTASAEVSSAPIPQTVRTKLTETDGLNEPDRPSTIPKNAKFVTKNIEDIQPGDLVLARDEHGTEIGWKPVKEVYRRISDHLRHLTFEADDGSRQTLSTTDEHPFWSETAGKFVEAGSLSLGDTVTESTGGQQSLVSSHREPMAGGTTVFNFQVEDFHTYFVGEQSGKQLLLVHNANYPSYPIGKTLIEEPGVTKILDKMGAGQRKKVDGLLEQIAHGRAGRNIHALKGDLAGHFAADIPGSGKGRGALRLIFQDTDIGILLKEIVDYH